MKKELRKVKSFLLILSSILMYSSCGMNVLDEKTSDPADAAGTVFTTSGEVSLFLPSELAIAEIDNESIGQLQIKNSESNISKYQVTLKDPSGILKLKNEGNGVFSFSIKEGSSVTSGALLEFTIEVIDNNGALQVFHPAITFLGDGEYSSGSTEVSSGAASVEVSSGSTEVSSGTPILTPPKKK